jgi:hypothetical protein
MLICFSFRDIQLDKQTGKCVCFLLATGFHQFRLINTSNINLNKDLKHVTDPEDIRRKPVYIFTTLFFCIFDFLHARLDLGRNLITTVEVIFLRKHSQLCEF